MQQGHGEVQQSRERARRSYAKSRYATARSSLEKCGEGEERKSSVCKGKVRNRNAPLGQSYEVQ